LIKISGFKAGNSSWQGEQPATPQLQKIRRNVWFECTRGLMIAVAFGTSMMLHRQEKMWLHHKLLGVAGNNSVAKKNDMRNDLKRNK